MKKYSWEDFENLTQYVTSCSDPNDPVLIQREQIINYFINNPKELMENGIFHRLGYNEEKIIKALKTGIVPFSF